MTMYTANQPLAVGGPIYMWNRFAQCKYLVNMGTAQLSKFGHQSRLQFMTKAGVPQLFIIDLSSKSFKPLNEVRLVSYSKTRSLLFKTLTALYAKTPHFSHFMDLISRAYPEICTQVEQPTLDTFNNLLVKELLKELLPSLTWVEDTDVIPSRPTSASQWVADFGHALNCNQYIGGGVAKTAYVDDQHWQQLQYVVQDWRMPEYTRPKAVNATAAQAVLSILDPCMYCGTAEVQSLIGSSSTACV